MSRRALVSAVKAAARRNGVFARQFSTPVKPAVASIEDLVFDFSKRNPPIIEVSFTAITNSSNFDVSLNPVHYVVPPEDGIWEFVLDAKPKGVGAQVITRHTKHMSVPSELVGGKDFQGIKVTTGNRTLTVDAPGGELTAGDHLSNASHEARIEVTP